MTAIFSNDGEKFSPFKRLKIDETRKPHNENWLQRILFENPEVVPMDEIFSGSLKFIPVCMELKIRNSTGSHVRLDIFGITHNAKLVLVECKLWRSPEARRQVVAQAMEYATILANLSYGDLVDQVKSTLSIKNGNPLFEKYRDKDGKYDQAEFHDRIVRDLKRGDFIIIIAGDGIRENVSSITDHLSQNSGMAAKLALVEFRIFKNESKDIFIVPNIFVRTKVIEHRFYVGHDNSPLIAEQAEDGSTKNVGIRADNAFWNDVVKSMKFDHPDQHSPWYVNNWIFIPMPKPLGHISAYRTKDGQAGISWTLKGDDGLSVYAEISTAMKNFEKEIKHKVKETRKRKDEFEVEMVITYGGNPFDDQKYKEWLIEYSNKTVSSLRAILAQIS